MNRTKQKQTHREQTDDRKREEESVNEGDR